ncbi:Uncharacterised protein [Mycobacteroides abscessus subsp. massiliense]|nr:Uncharacterised protein [Mycobacteroides abscessus subsp. massiliense]
MRVFPEQVRQSGADPDRLLSVLLNVVGEASRVLCADCLKDLSGDVVDDMLDDVPLALEVPVEGPVADPDSSGDIRDACGVIALLGEAREGGVQDLLPHFELFALDTAECGRTGRHKRRSYRP